MENIFSDFYNIYPVSKTLRFELIPQNETLEYLQRNGVLDNDEKRAEDYKKLKKLLDEYYRYYIDNTLADVELERLDEYYEIYIKTNKSKEDNDKLEFIETELRNQIATFLESGEKYGILFKKEVVEKELPLFLTGRNEDIEVVKSFKGFVSMCQGFFDNRKNIFTSEKISTSIAYRTIHENLPKFINNMRVYEAHIKEKICVSEELLNKLEVSSLDEMFTLSYFKRTLSQSGIECYNCMLGGFFEDEKLKIQGINELVNLSNQTNDGKKIPKLQPLYKQILSDTSSLSFVADKFESDGELIRCVKLLYDDFYDTFANENNKSTQLFASIDKYEINGIYVKNGKDITDFSNKLLGAWDTFKDGANKWYDESGIGTQKSEEKYNEERAAYLKKHESFSIGYIENVTGGSLSGIIANTINGLVSNVLAAYEEAGVLLNSEYPKDYNLKNDENSVRKIKLLLDAMKQFEALVKLFGGAGNEADRDELFYSEYADCITALLHVDSIYNKVRNYVTQKPYSTEKIKLTFDSPELMAGWPVTKEESNKAVIFVKDGLFYLGIMNKKYNKIFRDLNNSKGDDCYNKMVYLQSKDVTLTIPKCSTQVKAVKTHFVSSDDDYVLGGKRYLKPLVITREIFDLNNVLYGKYKKFQKGYLEETGDVEGYQRAVKVWIKFCMKFLESYDTTSQFDFSEVFPLEQYSSLDKFYSEVNKHLYKITFVDVSTEYIDQLVAEGKLYLFKIYNKDFSPFSKGRPNLHTMYWNALFAPENMKDIVYKLNGQAEVFYRKKSISNKERIIHTAGYEIDNKNPENEKKQSKFEYDIIKDRRFTVDKFQFHVPITMNFTADNRTRMNLEMRSAIKHSKDMHIIGIDRGERHLLYVTVIDLDGNIKEQFSLNEILNEYRGQSYRTNYHNLLDVKEKERTEARQEWKSIESIKELKDGYMSQVVHVISQLMIKYNAIVVMEDLNFGFKRGRQKVEKQVYQKFEKALIDKLNYLVDKTAEPSSPTGLYRALQLTEKFESFAKIGKQNGALFYVPAWNTSKMDPTTGFVNLLYLKYESVLKCKSFIEKIKDIRLIDENGEKFFAFDIDYNDFTEKAKGTQTEWQICSYGTRIVSMRNLSGYWEDKEIDITEEFIKLFDGANIDITKSIKPQVINQNSAEFFRKFMWLMRAVMQIRNSETNGVRDYLISPVRNKEGYFYNSENIVDGSLPENADANGAYNIARKGLWVVEKIKMTPEADLGSIKIAMTSKEWLEFAQR